MAATRWRFTFKCAKGHEIFKSFPLGTRVSGNDEITCSVCLQEGETNPAYVVFVCAEPHAKD